MLRRLPSTEVPAGSAPTVRSMLVPEAASVTRALEEARAQAASLRTLRRELAEYLAAALPQQARKLGLAAPQLQAWIEHEMARFAGAHRLCVRVHPDDAAQLDTAALIAARVPPITADERGIIAHGRADLPTLATALTKSANSLPREVCLLVGPEGGWTDEELQAVQAGACARTVGAHDAPRRDGRGGAGGGDGGAV